ncbi:hypothetical protein D3C71_1527930 [compost metagenome]
MEVFGRGLQLRHVLQFRLRKLSRDRQRQAGHKRLARCCGQQWNQARAHLECSPLVAILLEQAEHAVVSPGRHGGTASGVVAQLRDFPSQKLERIDLLNRRHAQRQRSRAQLVRARPVGGCRQTGSHQADEVVVGSAGGEVSDGRDVLERHGLGAVLQRVQQPVGDLDRLDAPAGILVLHLGV